MYIHFYSDSVYSQKFIEFINEQFNPKYHLHIIVMSKQLKYIEEKRYSNVYSVKIKSLKSIKRMRKLLKSFVSYDNQIYYHALSNHSMILTRLLGMSKYKKNWIIWGGDLYSELGLELMSPNTKSIIYDSKKTRGNIIKLVARRIYNKNMTALREKTVKATSNILTWNKGDYNLACEHYRVSPKHIDFVYNLGIDRKESISDKRSNSETMIMVGNSGDPSNNHIDIYEILSKLKGEFKVLSFLTYGDPDYIKKIITVGKEVLGSRYIPITEHMDRETYFKFINDIDVVIMNHYRQQGVGNILSFLQQGKKVYMNDFVTTYDYFKENDVFVFTNNELREVKQIDELTNYDEDTKKHNAKIIYELFSDEVILGKMKKIFQ